MKTPIAYLEAMGKARRENDQQAMKNARMGLFFGEMFNHHTRWPKE